MINPGQLIEVLAAALRDIPEVVEALGGDESRVIAYHDHFPRRTSLGSAIESMPAPGVLVAWERTEPGSVGEMTSMRHVFGVYIRAGETEDDPEAPSTSYYTLPMAILNGTPQNGSGLRFINEVLHPSCLPIDLPTFERQSDGAGVDYQRMEIVLQEFGMGD